RLAHCCISTRRGGGPEGGHHRSRAAAPDTESPLCLVVALTGVADPGRRLRFGTGRVWFRAVAHRATGKAAFGTGTSSGGGRLQCTREHTSTRRNRALGCRPEHHDG